MKTRSNIFTIMRKEFARFFGDKRLVITTLILPGLLIYVIYSFMGSGMESVFMPSDDEPTEIYAVNMPSTVRAALSQSTSKINITDTDKLSDEEIRQRIHEGDADIYVEFPESFDEYVAGFVPGAQEPFDIGIYYDSTDADSSSAYSTLSYVLDAIESSVANIYNINSDGKTYDVATEEDTTGMIFAMLMPLLLIMFIFSGCMSVAPESIAGEKERGTVAALLVTPVKRSEIAIGKIVSLSCIALLCGLSSFIGTMAALPKLMGSDSEGMGITASVYDIGDYVSLLFVVLSTVLFFVSVISIISAFAKSVKEASTLVTPLMIIVMVAGVSAMFGDGAQTSVVMYLIPIYNSVQCLSGIFSFSLSVAGLAVTVVSNLVYTAVAVYLLKKMFDSERIMFSR